jgi:transcriptional regulator with XRE-family HTH domain
MNMNEQIAGRLKAERERRGVSQRVLADWCGWAQSRVGNYESGARTIGLDDAIILAKALGISPIELIFGEVGSNQRQLSEKQLRLLDLFNQLPEKEQDNMLEAFSYRLKELDDFVEAYIRSRDKNKDLPPSTE